MTGKVGFIGLGAMGGPMALNLAKGGHRLVVHDIDQSKTAAVRAAGAELAGSGEAVAAAVERTIVIVETTDQAEAVIAGERGIIHGAKPGHIVLCMATIDPFAAKSLGERLKAKGIAMLDAPVSGGTVGAEAATIAIMVGGDKKVFDDALPVLQSFSANVIHMGELGTGTVAKLVNNMLAFCNAAAAAAGLMLGVTAGLDPKKLIQVVSNSSGNSNAFRSLSERAVSGDFKARFALDLAYKDLHLALELGDELGVPLQQGAATHNLQRMARGMKLGSSDSSAILRVYETALRRTVKG